MFRCFHLSSTVWAVTVRETTPIYPRTNARDADPPEKVHQKTGTRPIYFAALKETLSWCCKRDRVTDTTWQLGETAKCAGAGVGWT